MPFNIGDKVVVKHGEEGAFFDRDQEVIVLDVNHDMGRIKVDPDGVGEHWVRANRFNLAQRIVPPAVAVRKFQVGDLVRIADVEKNRLDPIHRDIRIGQQFVVIDVADRDVRDENGSQNIRIQRGGARWNSVRFELVAAVAQPVAQAPVAAWDNPFQARLIDDIEQQADRQRDALIADNNAGAELANAGVVAGNAIIQPAMPKFKVGDKVKLTGMNDVVGPGWVPDRMGKWVAEGREFIIRSIITNYNGDKDWFEVEDDDNHFYSFDFAWAELVDQWVVGAKIYYKNHIADFGGIDKCPEYYIASIEDDGRIKVYAQNERNYSFGPYEKSKWVLATDQEKAVPKKKAEEPKIDPVEQQKKIDKMLDKFRKRLVEGSHGCANFYLIKQDKKGELGHVGGVAQPCHYELRGGYGESKKKAVAVIDSISCRIEHLPEHKKQGFKDYVNYLLNRSPWSIAYKTKTYEDAVANCIDMNLDVTANIMVGACIAMRQSSEYSDVLPVHAFLKAKRFSGDVCFLVAQHFTMNEAGVFSPLNINSGHSILTTDMPSAEVFKFFATQEFVGEAKKKPYRENMVYENIFGSITGREAYARAKAGDVTIQQWMHKHCPIDDVGAGFARKQTVTEANILKLARAVKAELLKYKQVEVV